MKRDSTTFEGVHGGRRSLFEADDIAEAVGPAGLFRGRRRRGLLFPTDSLLEGREGRGIRRRWSSSRRTSRRPRERRTFFDVASCFSGLLSPFAVFAHSVHAGGE